MDMVAGAVVLAGAAVTCIAGLTEDRQDDRKAGAMTGGYVMLGAATLYGALRLIGPKSRRDQLLSRMTEWYDQADSYQQRAQVYRKAAEQLLKRLASFRGKDQ
jgi:hypothetical protein